MTRRFAAYLLAALMILGTLPLIVSAAGEDTFYSITADAGFVFTVYNEETEDDEEVTKAIPGTEVYIDYTNDFTDVIPAGYHFSGYTVNGTVTDDIMFIMPESDVVIGLAFEKNIPFVEIDLTNGKAEIKYEVYGALYSLDCAVSYSDDEDFPKDATGTIAIDLDGDGKFDVIATEYGTQSDDTEDDETSETSSEPDDTDEPEDTDESGDDTNEEPDEHYFIEKYKDSSIKESITVSIVDDYRTIPFDAIKITFGTEAPAVPKGDANGDGDIDSLDAVVIFKYDAGLVDLTAEQLAYCDVTGDGEVDSLDSVVILKYDAGIIDDLG